MYREKFTFTVTFASLDRDGIMLCAGMRQDRQCTYNVTARRVRVAAKTITSNANISKLFLVKN